VTSPTPAPGPPARHVRVIATVLVAMAIIALSLVFWPRQSDSQATMLRGIMISDLTGLRNSEIAFYRQFGRFTTAIDSTPFLSSFGVNRPTVTLADSGWSATITHPRLPGETCAVAMLTKNPLQADAGSGEVVCR
jgi:hypothetical protein